MIRLAKTVEALVDAGQASMGPPLGPALGPLGVNIKSVVDEINKETSKFKGMRVPVKVIVDDKRNFTIEVGIPPTSSLLLSEAKVEKGSGTPNSEKVGNITLDQIIKVAKMKKDAMLASSIKTAVKEAVGTCVSIGLTVEGLEPKEILSEIDEGKYDSKF